MQREGAMEHQRLNKGAPGCGATQAVGCGAASVRRGVCIDARKAARTRSRMARTQHGRVGRVLRDSGRCDFDCPGLRFDVRAAVFF